MSGFSEAANVMQHGAPTFLFASVLSLAALGSLSVKPAHADYSFSLLSAGPSGDVYVSGPSGNVAVGGGCRVTTTGSSTDTYIVQASLLLTNNATPDDHETLETTGVVNQAGASYVDYPLPLVANPTKTYVLTTGSWHVDYVISVRKSTDRVPRSATAYNNFQVKDSTAMMSNDSQAVFAPTTLPSVYTQDGGIQDVLAQVRDNGALLPKSVLHH